VHQNKLIAVIVVVVGVMGSLAIISNMVISPGECISVTFFGDSGVQRCKEGDSNLNAQQTSDFKTIITETADLEIQQLETEKQRILSSEQQDLEKISSIDLNIKNVEMKQSEIIKALPYLQSSDYKLLQKNLEQVKFDITQLKKDTVRDRDILDSIRTCPDGTELMNGICVDKEIFVSPYYGSISYDSFDKSPFTALQENHEMYWILEDFKDGTMNARGVLISPDYTVIPGYSVDKDDGIRDQVGDEGGSMLFKYKYIIQIKFDKRQLEEFPTHAGFVVTSHSTHNNNFPAIFKFEAFDSDGELIISVPNLTSGRDGKSTTDDKFFGVYDKDGIQSIQLTAQGPANIFIDHLQYGR